MSVTRGASLKLPSNKAVLAKLKTLVKTCKEKKTTLNVTLVVYSDNQWRLFHDPKTDTKYREGVVYHCSRTYEIKSTSRPFYSAMMMRHDVYKNASQYGEVECLV